MRTSVLLYAGIIGAIFSLAAGYFFADLPLMTAPILLIGVVWVAAEIRGWRWIGSISLFLLIIGSAVGIIVEVDPIWAIMGTVLALAGWELSYFRRFLKKAPWVRNEDQLVRRHHTRVIAVALIGGVTAWLTTQIEVDIGFGVALLLAILSLLGLSRAVIFLRRTD
ncbi:MAG: hypothetical protein BMS9Abin02_0415 [Anaerolineae bacterium]|nr:MAG: hypothetical protein BMS9Abin02_0415 [Anaerolineae bacterium]